MSSIGGNQWLLLILDGLKLLGALSLVALMMFVFTIAFVIVLNVTTRRG